MTPTPIDDATPNGRIPALEAGAPLLIGCPLSPEALAQAPALLSQLTPAERDQATALPPRRAGVFIVSRALLRSAGAQLYGCAPAELQIERDANGKPAFAGDAASLSFNYSHSRDWLLLAFIRGGRLGVDVESQQRRNNFDAIAERYFHASEVAVLKALDDESRRRHFMTLWTFKEAYAKALGLGLAGTLGGMRFVFSTDGSTAALHADGAAQWDGQVRGWQWCLAPHSTAALVYLSDQPGSAIPNSATDRAPRLLLARACAGAFDYSGWQPPLLCELAISRP